MIARTALALVVASLASPSAAHDAWISRGVYKNPAGEWCCGTSDCGVMSAGSVKAVAGGYAVRGHVIYGAAVTGSDADGPTRSERVDEFWPYSSVLPSPDGAYWRCRRSDGTPRCPFAPPPGS